MEGTNKNKLTKVEHAGALDSKLRNFLQNPRKIVSPYVKEGMSVLDIGCGPGFFTVEMAKLVGNHGKVVAADLQEDMLGLVRKKIEKTSIQKIVELYHCKKDKIGLTEAFDFILLFYVLHEVDNQSAFVEEIYSLLKPKGRVLIVEPKIHVSKKEFNQSKEILDNFGFEMIEEPSVFFSKTALMKKRDKK
jgi:ubiquinone/menaquinone biosynthesis C-methylase UbiE